MNESYNKELCEERHGNIDKAFGRVFKKVEELGIKLEKFSGKLAGFLVAIILTLLGILLNIAITLLSNGK